MNNALGLVEAIGRAAAIVAVDTILKAANVTLIGIEPSKGGGMYAIKIEGDVGAVKAAVDSVKSLEELQNKIFTSKVIPRPATGIDKLIYNSVTIGYEQKVEDAILEVIQEEAKEAAQETVEVTAEDQTQNPNEENHADQTETTEAVDTLATKSVQKDDESNLAVIVETTSEPAKEVETDVAEPKVEVVETEVPEPVQEVLELKVDEPTPTETEEITSEPIEMIEANHESASTLAVEEVGSKAKKVEKKEATPIKAVKAESKSVKKEVVCNICNDPKCKRKRGEPKNLCIHYNTKST